MFCKKGVLENFSNFIGKHLCWSLLLMKLQASKLTIKTPERRRHHSGIFIANFVTCNVIKKRLQHRCFPVKVTKFLTTPILKKFKKFRDYLFMIKKFIFTFYVFITGLFFWNLMEKEVPILIACTLISPFGWMLLFTNLFWVFCSAPLPLIALWFLLM